MITYGFSIQGKSHIERGCVCQDYNKIEKLNNEWYLGIVADGVGSAIYSDVGSRLAAELLCEFCQKNIHQKTTDQKLEDLLRQGYKYAIEGIAQNAQKEKNAIDHYDTTLSAVLYNGEKVIYGHAGDGGILVRQCDGRIKPITQRQKGADGSSVRPLRAGESSWEFGIYEEKVASVLLATDGMLDGVFQPILVNLPPDIASLARGDFPKDNAYITASEFFMNPNGVYLNKKIANADKFMEKYILGDWKEREQKDFLNCMRENYIKLLGKKNAAQVCKTISKYDYIIKAFENITDDKSVVCLIDERAKVIPQDISYYYEPNWNWRQEKYHALLYGKPIPPVPEDDPMYADDTSSRKKRITSDPERKLKMESSVASKEGTELDEKREMKDIGKKVMILCPILCLFLIAGIVIGLFMARGGKGDNKRIVETARVTEMPTSTPKATTEPEMEEIKLTELEKEEIAARAEKFVEVLAEIDLSEQVDDDIAMLKNSLSYLDDEQIDFLGDKQQSMRSHINHGTSSLDAGNKTLSVSWEKKLGDIKNHKIRKIIGYVLLINMDYEIQCFSEQLNKKYAILSEKGKKSVKKNLEYLLDIQEER